MSDTQKRPIESPDSIPSVKKKMQTQNNMEVGRMEFADLMKAMSSLLDSKLEHLATKEDLNKELQNLKTENEELKRDVRRLTDQGNMFLARIEKLENVQRQNNLIFSGIPHPTQNLLLNIAKFCEEKLELTNVNVLRASYLGLPSNNLIIAEFPSSNEISAILSKGTLLKGSAYTINKDYTKEMRQKRAILFRARKWLLRRKPGLKIQIRGATLQMEGISLCLQDNKLIPRTQSDQQELEKILEENLISELENVENFYANEKNQNNVAVNGSNQQNLD